MSIYILVDELQNGSPYVVLEKSSNVNTSILKYGTIKTPDQLRELQQSFITDDNVGFCNKVSVHIDVYTPEFRSAAMYYKWTIAKSRIGDAPYIEMFTNIFSK